MTPDQMTEQIQERAQSGFLNIIGGGCCGSTPDQIRAIAHAVDGKTPRRPVDGNHRMRLSGLEAFNA